MGSKVVCERPPPPAIEQKAPKYNANIIYEGDRRHDENRTAPLCARKKLILKFFSILYSNMASML